MVLEPATKITLREREMVTSDVLVMRFSRPPNFVFAPGQFVQVAVPADGQLFLRSYSISSTPDKPYLEFCTKLIPGGKASTMFAHLKPGDVCTIGPGRGVFVEPSGGEARPAVFVTTGTGVAPVASMVEARLARATAPTTLVFGVRAEKDVFWRERFEVLAEKHASFNFVLSLSQPRESWTGAVGRVTKYVPTNQPKDTEYYLCGSAPMVKDVRALLLGAGVNTKCIHFEIY